MARSVRCRDSPLDRVDGLGYEVAMGRRHLPVKPERGQHKVTIRYVAQLELAELVLEEAAQRLVAIPRGWSRVVTNQWGAVGEGESHWRRRRWW